MEAPGQEVAAPLFDVGSVSNVLSQGRSCSFRSNLNMMSQTTFPHAGSRFHSNPIFQSPTASSPPSPTTASYYSPAHWSGLFVSQPENTGGQADRPYTSTPSSTAPSIKASLSAGSLLQLPASGPTPTSVPPKSEQSESAQPAMSHRLTSTSDESSVQMVVDVPKPYGSQDHDRPGPTQLAAQPGQANPHVGQNSANIGMCREERPRARHTISIV